MRLIEFLASHGSADTIPRKDALQAIFRLAHLVTSPGCLPNHPQWAELASKMYAEAVADMDTTAHTT